MILAPFRYLKPNLKLKTFAMRILLINPFYPISETPSPPLGLAYLAAALEEAGVEVRVLDLVVSPYSEEMLAGLLEEFRPGLVGLTAVTMNVDRRPGGARGREAPCPAGLHGHRRAACHLQRRGDARGLPGPGRGGHRRGRADRGRPRPRRRGRRRVLESVTGSPVASRTASASRRAGEFIRDLDTPAHARPAPAAARPLPRPGHADQHDHLPRLPPSLHLLRRPPDGGRPAALPQPGAGGGRAGRSRHAGVSPGQPRRRPVHRRPAPVHGRLRRDPAAGSDRPVDLLRPGGHGRPTSCSPK